MLSLDERDVADTYLSLADGETDDVSFTDIDVSAHTGVIEHAVRTDDDEIGGTLSIAAVDTESAPDAETPTPPPGTAGPATEDDTADREATGEQAGDADGADETALTPAGDVDGSTVETDDSVPGFNGLAGVVGVLTLLVYARYRVGSQPR